MTLPDLRLHHCDPEVARAQRQATVAAARTLIGTPWRHRGRKPWAVDCIGLLVLAFQAAGYRVEDRLDYGREPWKEGLQQGLAARFHGPIAEPDWQPGDVALFHFPGKAPCHLGILADYRHGGLSLIHAHSHFNTAEHGFDGVWRRLLVEVYSPWPK